MKKSLFLSFPLFFFIVAAVAQFSPPSAELIQRKLQTLPAHPRILFLAQEEAVLKQQLKNDPSRAGLHQAIVEECERILSLPPVERIQIGRRLLDKSRECLRRVLQLSYAYRMTGEEKFLKRAEQEMLAVSAFSDWNPSHFLDVAEMTMALAIGYDWLYDKLPEASRKAIREAIHHKGITPSYDDKYNWFLRAEHNWNQVCNAGMTYGVLAIAEDEPALAARTIHRALETVPTSMYPYGPDGGYPEGYGYWGYGTSFNVLLISALEKALGTDFGLSNIQGYLKTGSFLQNMTGPVGQVHNWGDSGLRAGLSPAMFWFADRVGDPTLLWTQRPFLTGDQARNVRDRLLPTLLIWGQKIDFNAIRPPSQRIWTGQGPSPVGLMRTSWTDPDAIFVGFKGGSASVNHAHMDVGSFVLDALGERWAMDFGPQEYHSLEVRGIQLFGRNQEAERWQIFRYNNLVHNTLTIDNQHHRVKGYAQIDGWSDKPGHLSIISDLSRVFEGQASQVKRGIAIRDDKYVVVRDEVKAPEKAINVRWTLLTPADVRITDKKTVELSQNGKKLYLVFDAAVDLKIRTWSTEPTHDYDAPNPGTTLVGFEATVPAGSAQAFNACFTATPGTTPPVSPLSAWPVKEK